VTKKINGLNRKRGYSYIKQALGRPKDGCVNTLGKETMNKNW
jgi:hypothetical protein